MRLELSCCLFCFSYSNVHRGFRYQSERCDRSIGTCLNNQLYHLEIQDLDRISKGLEPLYNITRYGGGTQNTRQVTSVSNGGGLALRLPLKGIKTSLVTLELKADNVTLVMNRAPGKILSSEVGFWERLFSFVLESASFLLGLIFSYCRCSFYKTDNYRCALLMVWCVEGSKL